jgi:hypothetical protein
MRMAQRIIDLHGKRNVPPFKGGTHHYFMPGATGVNAAQRAPQGARPVVLRWQF